MPSRQPHRRLSAWYPRHVPESFGWNQAGRLQVEREHAAGLQLEGELPARGLRLDQALQEFFTGAALAGRLDRGERHPVGGGQPRGQFVTLVKDEDWEKLVASKL